MAAILRSVLFVCDRNALRSPMAEALLKRSHGRTLYIDSVGVHEDPLDPLAVEVMAELGIDLSAHAAKRLDELMDTSFDLVVTLSPEAHHRALELTRSSACEVEYWKTLDPSSVEGSREVRLAAYRAVRDALVERIRARFGGADEGAPAGARESA